MKGVNITECHSCGIQVRTVEPCLWSYIPQVGAVEGSDYVCSGLSAGGQAARLPGLLLRVDWRAGKDVELLRVVVAATHSHPSVLQLLQLMRADIQKGNMTNGTQK